MLRLTSSGARDRLRPARALLTFAAAGLLAAPLSAQDAPRVDYESFTLDNGLRVIVHEDHSVPIVAVNVWYDVGSAHEEVGRSGFAHLFEHMLFEETQNLNAGDFTELVMGAGGTYNGTTNTDRTAYFETMPSNRLDLALWLEAERMRNLRVTQENFAREREVVKEERRMRIENQPYGEALGITLDTLAVDYAPYKHSVIGSMDDLNAATTEDVMRFYRNYYVPNNATLVLAGDVTPARARELAERYFGAIPRGPDVPPLPPATAAPRKSGERRAVVEDPKANTPMYAAAYVIPPANHEDMYALDLLSRILSQGESSRLHQRLVKEEQAAAFAGGGVDTRRGPGLFRFISLPTPGSNVERIETLIEDELRQVREDGVSARELQKAKNQTRANMIMSRQTVFSRAMDLQQARVYSGDIEAVNTDLDRYQQVTLEDIQRVARTYLVPDNRTTVIVVPAGEAAPAADTTS